MPHKKSPVFVKLAFASFMTYGSIFFKYNIYIAMNFKKNQNFGKIFSFFQLILEIIEIPENGKIYQKF